MKDRVTQAIAAGRGAIVANWRPFVLIQACAVAFVVAYYQIPGAEAATASLAQLKVRGGLPLSAFTTAFAGAVIPAVAKRLTGMGKGKFDWGDFAFQFAFFAFLGVTIDLLYQGLAVVFGDVATPAVVFKKVLVDQFVYAPLVSITLSTTIFLWKDAGFSIAKTRELGKGGVWAARYVSLLIMCWSFWGPMLACVYAMPTDLQFCLFLCAQGAWGLLLLSISGR